MSRATTRTPIQDSMVDAPPEKEFIFEGEAKRQLLAEMVTGSDDLPSSKVMLRLCTASRIRVGPMSTPVPPAAFHPPKEVETGHLATVIVTPAGDVGCRVWYAE
jgi:hypothetical protein